MSCIEPVKPEIFEEDAKPDFDWAGLSGDIEDALSKLQLKGLLTNTNSPWSETFKLCNIKFTLTLYWTTGISSEFVTKKNYEIETVSPKKTEKGESSDSDDQGYRSLNEQDEMPKAWLDMMDTSNMFPIRSPHRLHECYGLKDFIVMTKDEIISDVDSWILLDSLSTAARKLKWKVPLFVKCDDLEYPCLFRGSLEYSGFRTSFDMLKYPPSCTDFLNDFLTFKKLYREKSLMESVEESEFETKFSARLTYFFNVLANYPCKPDFPTERISFNGFYLRATWSEVSLKSKYIYDLNPFDAHKWSVEPEITEPYDGPLGECLTKFISLCSSIQTESLLLNPQISSMLKYRRIYKREEVNASLAMQGSIEPKVRKVTSKLILNPAESLIPVESLNTILDFLFCDETFQPPQHLNEGNLSTTNTPEDEVDDKFFLSYKKLSEYFNSARSSSLTGRLAICLCIVNNYLGGIGAVKQLWGEFVLEIKYCWEHNCEIKGLEPVESDVDYAELFQKLQILNSCIKKKKARDASSSITEESTSATVGCKAGISAKEFIDISALPLSENIGQSEVRVDTPTIGLRVQMLIDRLSDKKTFSSANPGYVLGDFVRWCSTGDCMEEMNVDEGDKSTDEAHPSQWIKISEDVSLVLHKSVQKRRMIPEEEEDAAKVLNWLALAKASDLVFGLMPVLIHSAVTTLLKDSMCHQFPFLENLIKEAKMKLEQAYPESRNDLCSSANAIPDKLKKVEDLVQLLKLIEKQMTVAQWLFDEFRYADCYDILGNIDSEIRKFVDDLMTKGEVSVPTSHKELPSETNLGKLIYRLSLGVDRPIRPRKGYDDETKFIEPIKQEYIFAANCSRQTDSLKCIPQRFHCISCEGEYFVSGAFTSKML